MIDKALYKKSPNIGIFCNSNNNVTVVPPATPNSFKEKAEKNLGTEILETTVSNSNLIGIFTAMNNEKIIAPPTLTQREKDNFKEHFNEVIQLETKYTAIGNLISMNDHAIAASDIINTDKLNLNELKLAGSELIGSCLFVTNDGYLAHRDASQKELQKVQDVFEVEGDVGTVNFGDPYVKTGMIGNDEGILIGEETTGPELNRVDEIFMLK